MSLDFIFAYFVIINIPYLTVFLNFTAHTCITVLADLPIIVGSEERLAFSFVPLNVGYTVIVKRDFVYCKYTNTQCILGLPIYNYTVHVYIDVLCCHASTVVNYFCHKLNMLQ